MAKAKGKVIKKVLFFIGLGMLVAGGTYLATNKTGEIGEFIDKIVETNQFKGKLEKPTNFAFNSETNMLSWDAVENADSYFVQMQLNGATCCTTEVDGTSWDVNECDEAIYQGDRLTFNVKATGENYYSSGATTIEYVAEKSDEQARQNTVNSINKFISYNTLNSIDSLSFSDGNANGVVKYTKNDKDYINVFSFQSDLFSNNETFRNFKSNVERLNKFTDKSINKCQGQILNYDVTSVVENRLGIDLSNVEEIVLYRRDNANSDSFFDMYIQIKENDKIIHKNYTFASDKNFLGTLEEIAMQIGDEEKFDCTCTLTFEENVNEKDEYLDQLREDCGLVSQNNQKDSEMELG